ncbi:hypothetical protein QR680_019066 [Steinernema hermaphroditum]|uniref:Uncharacterized protein n=1 Tax=Steinernema hermaphroditum TaxID=289476 RepID=A0AA39LRP2_9BILA|nr:hypothetical protein QR680_019066 [Steinernema hermaphroditum]
MTEEKKKVVHLVKVGRQVPGPSTAQPNAKILVKKALPEQRPQDVKYILVKKGHSTGQTLKRLSKDHSPERVKRIFKLLRNAKIESGTEPSTELNVDEAKEIEKESDKKADDERQKPAKKKAKRSSSPQDMFPPSPAFKMAPNVIPGLTVTSTPPPEYTLPPTPASLSPPSTSAPPQEVKPLPPPQRPRTVWRYYTDEEYIRNLIQICLPGDLAPTKSLKDELDDLTDHIMPDIREQNGTVTYCVV